MLSSPWFIMEKTVPPIEPMAHDDVVAGLAAEPGRREVDEGGAPSSRRTERSSNVVATDGAQRWSRSPLVPLRGHQLRPKPAITMPVDSAAAIYVNPCPHLIIKQSRGKVQQYGLHAADLERSRIGAASWSQHEMSAVTLLRRTPELLRRGHLLCRPQRFPPG